MNILESQVNDLNYIAESPIAIPVFDTMNGQQQQPQPQSSESPADTGAQSGKKRKNDSGEGGDSTSNGNKEGTPHTRAKRNRYISIAWCVNISSVSFFLSLFVCMCVLMWLLGTLVDAQLLCA